MAEQVLRVFSEKKTPYAVEAKGIMKDLKADLKIDTLTDVKVFNRYDISGITKEEYEKAKSVVFSEPPVDNVYDETIDTSDCCYVLAIEALPGQYDQRADSAAQCVQFLTQKDRPIVKTARIICFYGSMTDEQKIAVDGYLINPVEARKASFDKPETLEDVFDIPTTVSNIDNFISMSDSELKNLRSSMGLAMSDADVKFTQDFFKEQGDGRLDLRMELLQKHKRFHTVIRNNEVLGDLLRQAAAEENEHGTYWRDVTSRYLETFFFLLLRSYTEDEKTRRRMIIIFMPVR